MDSMHADQREFRREEYSQVPEDFDLFNRHAIQYKLWWLSRVLLTRDDHSLALVWIEHEIVPADPVTNVINIRL